jgi:hypothetical protein
VTKDSQAVRIVSARLGANVDMGVTLRVAGEAEMAPGRLEAHLDIPRVLGDVEGYILKE